MPFAANFACWVFAAVLLQPLLATPGRAAPPGAGYSEPAPPSERPKVEDWLTRRLAADPDNASLWRMLGRVRKRQNRLDGARDALEKAVRLEPAAAAARFDLGRVLLDLGQSEAARVHLQQVIELAPESRYAQKARPLLKTLPAEPSADESEVQPIDYRIRNFDGRDTLPTPPSERTTRDEPATTATAEPSSPLHVLVEAGGLFNSNVALAPLSRELQPEEPESFQGFIAPSVQWSAIDRRWWRTGPTFSGHFTLNEGNFSRFNLQSYQPGWFAESYHAVDNVLLVPRLAYAFTHDEFNGTTFGNRHALSTSILASWSERDNTLLYWTIDYSDFADDGLVRSINSQDGWTNVIGLSHDHFLHQGPWKLIRGGVDYTNADTRGSDFRFNGVNLFAETVFDLSYGVELTLTGGWGYRDYFDFEFEPSRNENIWRAGAELRKQLTPHWSVAGVFNYVRFDSDNPLFEAERFLAGVVTTWEY